MDTDTAHTKAESDRNTWTYCRGIVSSLRYKLEEAIEKENAAHNEYVESVNEYYCLAHDVKKGDIILCEDKEFEFVEFATVSTDPMVHPQLASRKFSKKIVQLHMYDWKTQERTKFNDLKL